MKAAVRFNFFAFLLKTIFAVLCSQSSHAHYICVFHNLMSYDFSFIMQYLQENRVHPEIIFVIEYNDMGQFGQFTNEFEIEQKALRMSTKKGSLPFLFAVELSFNYDGPAPDKHFFAEKHETTKTRGLSDLEAQLGIPMDFFPGTALILRI